MILRSTGSKEMGTKPPVFAKFQNAVKNMVKSDDFNPPKRRDRWNTLFQIHEGDAALTKTIKMAMLKNKLEK